MALSCSLGDRCRQRAVDKAWTPQGFATARRVAEASALALVALAPEVPALDEIAFATRDAMMVPLAAPRRGVPEEAQGRRGKGGLTKRGDAGSVRTRTEVGRAK